MAFAFMCHHNTFLIYQSMRDSSLEQWEKVTHISVGWVLSACCPFFHCHLRFIFIFYDFKSFAWVVATLFGITGYATFTTLSQGNLFLELKFNCTWEHQTTWCFGCWRLFSLSLGDLLENYCYDDMNLARVLFCVSILLTFPLECFVSREVI